jgi:hypothetical protein
MAGWFAVVVALLLVITISIAYVLMLRELRRINANLEQFIKLVLDARTNDPPNVEAASAAGTHQSRPSSRYHSS